MPPVDHVDRRPTEMKFRLLAAFLLAAAFSAGRASIAQDGDKTKDKEKRVRRLLDVSGGTEIAQAQFDEMSAQFAANPNIPAGFAKKFKEVAKPTDMID